MYSRTFCLAVALLVMTLSSSRAAASMLGGGISESSTDNGLNTEAAAVAVQKLNADITRSNSLDLQAPLTLESVKSVSTQVVAGMLYHFVLEVKDASGKVADIAVKLWSKPWLQRSNDAATQEQAWQLTEAKLAP